MTGGEQLAGMEHDMTSSRAIRSIAFWAGLWAGLWIAAGPLIAEEAELTSARAGETLAREEFLQIRMGIPVRIVVYAPSSAVANEAADAAYRKLRQVDRLMSDYDPDSELMQLTAKAEVGTPQTVSQELFLVLLAARQLSIETDGAFDVTIGPVVKLWRLARRKKQLPDPEVLKQSLERVGFQHYSLDSESCTVTFHRSDMQLDLGGIAKGYAADQALAVLREHGVTRALIDAGGDIVVGEAPPDRAGWRIEVEIPGESASAEREAIILELKNQAVATSGDAYQFVEVDGVRYSHLIDPRTGIGMTTSGSVTVVAPTGIQADGLASALSVMGPEQGLQLIATKANTAALIFENQGDDQLRKFESSRWDELPKAIEETP